MIYKWNLQMQLFLMKVDTETENDEKCLDQ